MKRLTVFFGIAAFALLSGAARADTYPAKPIKMLVPFPAGGTVDFFARTVGPRLAEALGQPVLIENRAGAGGNIAAEAVAKSPADGYTLLMGSEIVSINITLYEKLGYDPVKDLAPVVLVGTVPNILLVSPSLPVKTTQELIAYAKSGKKMSYASTGLGTSSQLSSELFKSVAGIDVLHVPYKGGAPAIVDLAGGQVEMMFVNMPTGLPMVKGGKVRILAVTSAQRAPQVPDVPTIAETLPGFETAAWSAIYAPAGTPRAVIDKLNAAMVKILQMPDVKAALAEQGAVPAGGTPQALGEFTKSEIVKWAKIIKASGAKI
ncbi:tripartite tricarboxylate transporter substrate binding protein [Pigmentiphaga sp. H8]|uniref:Bug family tripartite tricarboxylate transporter substrate binding protein n=1 Tax=Pigmentiphaga sp. H8 TaxID=2488560 RepID=UPI000F58F582|nr:tripartite tricarboxylate transporter substrate binding protein [Pigmentiphaga sp. H8]AZG07827.1 tripartite tricarboxylate transporter substrate binding protein [Pigmentiphaga sp. H8]